MSVQPVPNIFPNNTILNETINSIPVSLANTTGMALQIAVSGTPTGSFKLQASADAPIISLNQPIIVTNWSDVVDSSQAAPTNGNLYWDISPINGSYVRAVYTSTLVESGSITAISDTGALQTQTVTAVNDVSGSLNSKYFLLSSMDKTTKAQKNFYMWFNINSAGVDPMVPGATAIPITGATNVVAATLATSMRSALNALTNDFTATGSSAAVIITNVAPGPVTAVADGPSGHATGFTIGSVTTGIASNLNNTYFLLDGGNAVDWYIWFNISGLGTDPAVRGRTGVQVTASAGATASTIGGDIRTALASVTSVNTIAGSGAVATFDQVSAQYHGHLIDGTPPTGFTLSYTSSTATTTDSTMVLKG